MQVALDVLQKIQATPNVAKTPNHTSGDILRSNIYPSPGAVFWRGYGISRNPILDVRTRTYVHAQRLYNVWENFELKKQHKMAKWYHTSKHVT